MPQYIVINEVDGAGLAATVEIADSALEAVYQRTEGLNQATARVVAVARNDTVSGWLLPVEVQVVEKIVPTVASARRFSGLNELA